VLLLSPTSALRPDVFEPRRVRFRDRIAARLRAHALDRQLADGVPPERGAALSLRARRLIEPGFAAVLAHGLTRIVREARTRELPRGRVAFRLSAVREVADELDELAVRLLGLRPVAVRGVAHVNLLLTDGTGPLYSSGAREDLVGAVRRARAALELL
jgi:hypothetical protein